MSKGTVLVTGANGYIAARTIEAFLQAGYTVRGTARSKPTTQGLRDALAKYGDKLEIVEVPDITVPGAFDNAVQGVIAIAHLASPVSFSFTDPEPVMKAAVEGVTRVLESASRAPSVKHFVLMSSIVAIGVASETDRVYTEDQWNDESEAVVARDGKEAPGVAIYAASKAASERAFWKYRDEHKPQFTQTAINPVFVAGPPLVRPASVDQINATTRFAWDAYTGDFQQKLDSAATTPALFLAYVDVRDVARLTVYGVEHADKANGERIIASAAYGHPQAIIDVLRKAYPERKHIIPEGQPGQGYLPGFEFPAGNSSFGAKAVRLTGQDFIPFEKTVLDAVEAFKHLE